VEGGDAESLRLARLAAPLALQFAPAAAILSAMTWNDSLHWLNRHEVWLGALAAVGAILAVWRDVLRLLSWLLSRALAMLPTRHQRTTAKVDLRFVPVAPRCFWHIGKRGTDPAMQVETDWNVTNLSAIPLRLLSARLVKPRLRDPKGFSRVHGAPTLGDVHSSQFAIPPGGTWHVAIGFYVGPPTQRATKPLRVKIAVTDQLAQEHRLPPLLLADLGTAPQPTPWWRFW
jgi:hypothetical protein